MQAAQPRTPPVETVDSALTARFSWDYREAEDDRVSALYQRAKARGWDAARDLPWDTAVDQEALARQDAARRSGLAGADLHGTAFAKWSAGNWLKFAVESQNWTLSQFLHGEQGALLAAGRLIETSPSLQAKMYAGIQAADEARHVEAFSRYLGTKLSGSYPVNTHLRSFMFDLLADSRWDITFLGMQIMIEGLALAAFGILYQTTTEPLLRTLLKLARADEARHVAFGITELQPCYLELTESEISERQEFALEAAVRLRDRLLRQEVWERLGIPFAEAREVLSVSPAHRAFQRSLFVKVLGNCERLGLLDYRGGWLREKLAVYGFLAARQAYAKPYLQTGSLSWKVHRRSSQRTPRPASPPRRKTAGHST